MAEASYPLGDRLRSFLYMLGISFLVWLALTASLQAQELLVGAGVCLALSLALNTGYIRLGLPPLSAKRIVFFAVYLVVLLWEIIKANFDVAYRVVHPAMPINPGIVVIRTELKSDIAKMVLANSITLTPGTFTLDIIGDKLLIHWINVKAESVEDATRLIGERFERHLRVIFQ
ncbi:MAG: Na+/H+ antiporter subunit E [Planctomycetes bacterium]|nr:Na+/H+ antiporter subunit E [Planctomycetota bacterium]